MTTPLPITHIVFGLKIPEGRRCNENVFSPTLIVWPIN